MSGDRLKTLNDELRGQTGGPWLPLESNPEVFSLFARKVGLPETHEWQDVLGLDPALLAMAPQPVAAAVLLFPCTPGIYEARREEDRALRAGSSTEAASKPFFVEQVASFGNACGTIAAVHALTNANIPRLQRGPVCAFRDETIGRTPAQRGAATAPQRRERHGRSACRGADGLPGARRPGPGSPLLCVRSRHG